MKSINTLLNPIYVKMCKTAIELQTVKEAGGFWLFKIHPDLLFDYESYRWYLVQDKIPEILLVVVVFV